METQAVRLRAIVDKVEPLLQRSSDADSMQPVLDGGWSRKQLLAHLIDSASNNHQRFVRAAQQDSLEFPGYDQSANIVVQNPQQASWAVLVALWSSYNRYLAHVIANLPANKLETACRIGDSGAVTLAFLVDDYVVHLEHHLNQIGITV